MYNVVTVRTILCHTLDHETVAKTLNQYYNVYKNSEK